MRSARKNSLWELRHRSREIKLIEQSSTEREKIGEYKTSKNPTLMPQFMSKENLYMTDPDKAVLKNFSQKKNQTLGDLMTINAIDGSSIISSLEKLVNFGLVKRDWEKEEEMHTDVIYSITPEGEYVVQKKVSLFQEKA